MLRIRVQRFVPLFLVTALLGAATLSAQEERWLHVRVDDRGERVRVNVPLSLVETVLSHLPTTVRHETRLELNDCGWEVAELREVWKELRESPDATFVTVESDHETVEVRKEGDLLIARTVERRERPTQVDVKIPVSVVDALFSGGEDELDLEAAVRALADSGLGDVVSVVDGATTVRIWIDESNEAR